MMNIIYHRADYDGIFCREIAKRSLQAADVEANYIGWDYGDPVPEIDRSLRTVMMDISIEPLMDLRDFFWIDHHKTAIDKYDNVTPDKRIPGYRIDGVAACRLAWQFWFGVSPRPTKFDFTDRVVNEPLAVRLAGEYDVWDKRDPDAELFNLGLDSVPITDKGWQLLLDGNVAFTKTVIDAGRIAQRFQQKRDADIMAHRSFRVNWHGLTFLCLNTARCNSLTFSSEVKESDDALLGFYYSPQNGWSVSLYHAPHNTKIDLSEIAKRYGGGGHRGACGFRTIEKPEFIP